MRLLVWTREEAKAAWKENRTEANLASILPETVNTVQSCSGSFVVDGKPTRVVICIDDAAKRWLLGEAPNTRILSQNKKVEEVRTETKNAIEEVHLEKEWRKNGCVKNSSGGWEVPDELMWRSLPRGEDR